jgi:glycosyltransferase involved in cell wall biosynthesis
VLIEAMACGVPVIGSTCGEIPNVIGDAGLTFPEGDVEALRTALMRVQRDVALRQDLAARGRARVLAHYTQQQIAEATVQVYRQMMNA